MFKIYKDLLFIVDEIVNNISACLFLCEKLNIQLEFIKKFHIHQNIYICIYRLRSYTYNGLHLLEKQIEYITKTTIPKKYVKIIKIIFPFYVFFNRKTKANIWFTEGAVICNHIFNKKIFMVDYFNGEYSMAQKSFNEYKINNFLYKSYKNNENGFYISYFLISKNTDEEKLIEAIQSLKNTLFILNKQDNWEQFCKFTENLYHIKLRRNNDGEEVT